MKVLLGNRKKPQALSSPSILSNILTFSFAQTGSGTGRLWTGFRKNGRTGARFESAIEREGCPHVRPPDSVKRCGGWEGQSAGVLVWCGVMWCGVVVVVILCVLFCVLFLSCLFCSKRLLSFWMNSVEHRTNYKTRLIQSIIQLNDDAV